MLETFIYAERIAQLDQVAGQSLRTAGVSTGLLWLNNLEKTDYINVVVHQLAHVRP